MTSDLGQAEREGAAIYTRATLAVYDVYVLQLSNALAWRCPRRRLLDQYDQQVSARHLDIGPGSGWYLAHARFPSPRPAVTLFDLNPTPLRFAARRLAKRGIEARSVTGSVLEPIAPRVTDRFDSAAANFVFHCVPGTWREKGRAFEYIADVLTDRAVFFGSTILGVGPEQNFAARSLMRLYNQKGIFHNADDDFLGLRGALGAAFSEVVVDVVGTVALFAARKPRRDREVT